MLPVPDVIKIDIGGSEHLALLGAETSIEKLHPTFFLATHGLDVHNQRCDYWARMRYELEPIDGREVLESREIIARYPG